MRGPLTLLLPVACAALLAQDQVRPSFKAGIGLVQIDVSVLDANRRPVRGLRASDFTILEDGQPRPVRVFEAVDLPARRPPVVAAAGAGAGVGAESEPVVSVATNQVGDQDGRLVFILMDRTIPTGQPVLAAKKIATAAIDALGPSDLAAIVTTGGNVPQTLTADRARLLRAVNQGDWSTIISPEQQEIPTVGKYDPLSDGRCLCGLCVLETVTNIAEAVRDTPRRSKLLLFVGTSIIVQTGPRPMAADPGCDNRVSDARHKMADALALSHLTVHSIDPSGLATKMFQGSGNGRPGGDAAVRRQQMLDETMQRMSDQGSLEVLPELTGGRTFINSNAPEQVVPQIFQESGAYYVLAFEPAAGSPGKRRAIDVKVAHRGARVSTTRYALPPGTPSAVAARNDGVTLSPLDLALAGLMPDARLPLEMAIAAFASADGPQAYVSVSLNAAAFGGYGAGPLPLDLGVTALDQRGRRVALVRQGATVIRPAGAPGDPAAPGQWDAHIPLRLPPGDYEVRAAIQARGTGAAASVFAQLTVPPFAEAPLSLSDLVLGTRENSEPPPDAATPDFPIVASTQRTFRRSGVAWAYLQVYEGTRKTDALQPVSITTTIGDASGRTVKAESATIKEDAFVNRHAGIRLRLPLTELPPGSYVLRVGAARGARNAARAVAFAVE